MCAGSKLPLNGLLKHLFFLLLFLGGYAASAQVDFNISKLGSHRPYSGKSYADVWGEGDIACLGIWLGYDSSSTPYGVGIYDISNPSFPTLLSIYRAGSRSHNQFEHGAVRDKIGYFSSWSGGGVHIVSLTNPASPQTLSIINTASNGFSRVHTMFLERNYLYEAAHVAGIVSVKVFDISNPHAPVYLQDIVTTNTTKVHQITVANKGTNAILYTSGWGGNSDGNPSSFGQTDIWDVSNVGSQPALWLGRVYSGYSSHSSWPTPDGNTLVVCRETTGGEVRLYDITTPPNPTPHSITNPAPIAVISPANMGLAPDLPHNPVIVGNLLFISWFQHGIQIFDITDRTKPVRIGSYDTYLASSTANFQGNWGVHPFLGLNKLLLSDIQTGLWVMDASAVLTGTNNYAPFLVASPPSQMLQQGDTASFSPVITGSLLNYQWRMNGTNLPGATASSLSIPNAKPAHSGNYSVIAYNASGSVTSMVASLSVTGHPSAPSITAQPLSAFVYPEQSATFSVAVTGEAPFSFQWRYEGNDIPEATNATYHVPLVLPQHAGKYSVMITNIYGETLSSNAQLGIIDSPYINSVTAYRGSRSALVRWKTTIPADSKVDFGPVSEGAITGSSPKNRDLSTDHAVLLTGLQPGTAYNYQVVSRADGTNFLSAVYQFTTLSTTPIVLDNLSNGVSFAGTWGQSVNSAIFYGNDYRFANTNAETSAPARTATFTPVIPAAGLYDIDVWHPSDNNRATNAPFQVVYNGGNTLLHVNQTLNGGQWFPLIRKVPFAAGNSGYVRLGSNASGTLSSGVVVVADAVRFTYSQEQEFPSDGSIPTWWSSGHFGSVVDPNIDHDGDGFTTGEEYILGTLPTSASSGLGVKVFRSGGTANVMFHPFHANRTYKLQHRSSLEDNWVTVETLPMAAGPDGDGVFSLPLTNSTQGFYRISVEFSTNNPAMDELAQRGTKERRMFVGEFAEPSCGPTRIYAE